MQSRLLLTLVLTLLLTPVHAEDKLGGASKPRPQMVMKRGFRQYKRIHQYALRLILLDRGDEAQKFLQSHLAADPEDPESHFLLGLLYARDGQLDKSLEMFRDAVVLGLPPERLLAGPRELIESVKDQELFVKLREFLSARPLHGPMLGNMTDTSADIWVRTSVESKVTVEVKPVKPADAAPVTASARSGRNDDFTAVVHVTGLKPNTNYRYTVSIDGQPAFDANNPPQFTTFPAPGEPSRFKIAFGGGAGYVPPHERMWDTISKFHPLALLLLGDNTYIDDPESPLMQQYTYHRRQSRPEFRRLTARTPVFSIWDDHDFGTNDCWGGPLVETPAWKRDYAWTIWKQNWPNPGFGGGRQQPGCWYNFSIGDVDFIMLDCRYYRTNPHDDNPSMLGPVQLKWLAQTLPKCRGTFKVICSSVPWDFRTKGDSLDTWNGYKEERERVFQMIERAKVPGVILMSADRHRSDAWKIERKNGYAFYEFNSSRLTNQHVHPTKENAGAIFSYNAKQSFGLVTFDTTKPDPEATYEVVTIDGEPVAKVTVKLSQLKY